MITNPQLPPKAGYVEVEVDSTRTYRNIYTGLTIEEENTTTKESTIESIRSQCQAAIIAGFDYNDEHFSLEETDQINLATALSSVQSGATSFPYHSDGNICRLYTSTEILNISQAATQHKLYHTTLCNHLLRQIEACSSVEELEAITYSVDSLSDELKSSFNSIILAAQSL